MHDVELNYRLTGKGWAECFLQIGGASSTITASYLSDPVSDLIVASEQLLQGAVEQRVSFLEEPGEFRLILSPETPSLLHVRVLSFTDSHPHRPDSAGSIIFDSQCDLLRFARAVSRTFQSVLDLHGVVGYKELWSTSDFPLSSLQSLKQSIRQKTNLPIST